LSPGAQLEVDLPAAGGAVTGRVARSEANGLAVVFSSDPVGLARIDRALDAIDGRRAAA
jgi:hypothetical protein